MMCKFRDRDSTATSDRASSLSYTLTQSRQWVAKKTQMTSLVMLLGLGGGFCLATEVITPQLAQADTAHVNLSLQGQPNETYEALLSRAEVVAKAAAGAKFDRDNRVTDVSIMLVAQNHGAIAPVLTLEVSRSQWRSRPDVQFWSTYFTTARSLLGFEDVATTTPGQPDTATPGTQEQPEDETPASATEDINMPDGEAETATPASTPEQSTPGEAETATPATTPSQTPDPGIDQSPQSPDPAVPVDPSEDSQSPTSPPNSDSPGFPSTSTPTDAPQAPLAVPPTSGTTNNNLTPTNVPESSGISPNNNPAPTPITPNGTIPGTIQPTTPGNLNNTIPNTTPNQNVTPEGTSLETEQ